MRNLFYIGLLVFGMISSSLAGDKVGNGGGAVVCRSLNSNDVIFAELLDLWEGKRLMDLPIDESSVDPDKQHFLAIAQLKSLSEEPLLKTLNLERIYLDVLEATKHIDEITKDLPLDIGINLTDDIHAAFYKKKLQKMSSANVRCGLEMVAYYGPDGVLQRDTEILDHFSLTSKAALKTHESIYKVARDFSEFAHGKESVLNDSTYVRRLVAHLYSNEPSKGEILNFLVFLFGFRPTEFLSMDIDPNDHQGVTLRVSILPKSTRHSRAFGLIVDDIFLGATFVYHDYFYDETGSNPTKIHDESVKLVSTSKETYKEERILLTGDIQKLRHKTIYLEGFLAPGTTIGQAIWIKDNDEAQTVRVKVELLGDNDSVLLEYSETLRLVKTVPIVVRFCDFY